MEFNPNPNTNLNPAPNGAGIQKERTVSQIKEGTVIDHISHGKLFDLVKILSLHKLEAGIVTAAANLPSTRCGKKGIIKIEGKFLSPEEVNKIAVISPNASMSTIKDYRVHSKTKLVIPKVIQNIIKCNNPNCISNHEQIDTKFHVMQQTPLKIKCNYCEVMINRENILIR